MTNNERTDGKGKMGRGRILKEGGIQIQIISATSYIQNIYAY